MTLIDHSLSGCVRCFSSPHERRHQTHADADSGGETSSLALLVSFTQALARALFFLYSVTHTHALRGHSHAILMETPKLDTLSVGEAIEY